MEWGGALIKVNLFSNFIFLLVTDILANKIIKSAFDEAICSGEESKILV